MKPYYVLFALLMPALGFAQNRNQNKEAEQIIITKKGATDGRMNIVVDGDNITVNGKPVDTDKDADITVKRKKIKDLDVYNEDGQFGRGRSFNILGDNGLQKFQAPNKAMLGVVTQKTEEGVTVVNVSEESPADKAGLKEGDVITTVDDKKIGAPDELSAAIKDKDPGDKVSIAYKRDNKSYTTQATLTKWKAPEGMGFNQGGGNFYSAPNIDFDDLMRQLPNQGNGNRNFRFYGTPGQEFGSSPKIGIRIQDLEKGDGVKVLDVDKDSDASKAGLKSGDIIQEINGQAVNSTDQASRMIRGSRKASLDFKINRNGKSQTLTLTQSARIKTADL
ncbi:PDZ domain-containing protein [Niabella beijingensis]|uniref:PDZ domain-containing protein n=1 Tax=Niabella beijingensis TaxID=2872700 RepID=UPI001CBCDA82|nr:PDZ domain-containing protein [Niabella beijingensis]MBZ4189646.1 PDZ domain-containing protein [Niabella beijingensis]